MLFDRTVLDVRIWGDQLIRNDRLEVTVAI